MGQRQKKEEERNSEAKSIVELLTGDEFGKYEILKSVIDED
jgi:hypothetical protein